MRGGRGRRTAARLPVGPIKVLFAGLALVLSRSVAFLSGLSAVVLFPGELEA